MTQVERPDLSGEIAPNLLGEPGVVEQLVRDGRGPHCVPAQSGYSNQLELKMFVFIPPVSLQSGDIADGQPGFGYRFFRKDPSGALIELGHAQTIVLDWELGNSVRRRAIEASELFNAEQS